MTFELDFKECPSKGIKQWEKVIPSIRKGEGKIKGSRTCRVWGRRDSGFTSEKGRVKRMCTSFKDGNDLRDPLGQDLRWEILAQKG